MKVVRRDEKNQEVSEVREVKEILPSVPSPPLTFHISAQPLSKLPSMQLTVASATHEKQTNKQTQQTGKQPLILQIEDTFQKMQPLW